MKNIIGFIGNFLTALIFGWDIMDYYFLGGINIINNDVNRFFIMWFGFTVSVLSSAYFIHKHLNKQYNKK